MQVTFVIQNQLPAALLNLLLTLSFLWFGKKQLQKQLQDLYIQFDTVYAFISIPQPQALRSYLSLALEHLPSGLLCCLWAIMS